MNLYTGAEVRVKTTRINPGLPLVVLCLTLGTGCQQKQPTPETTGVDVPIPDLSRDDLHPRVVAQLREQIAALAKLQSTPDLDADSAERFGASGQVFHTYDYLDTAEGCYRIAGQLAPADHRWPYYLGQIYRTQGRTDLAIEQFQLALAADPAYAPTGISLAQMLRQENRGDQAIPVLEAVLTREPKNAVANYVMGQVLGDNDDVDGSIAHLERALEAQPQATRVHYTLSLALGKRGDEQSATKHLEQRGEGRLKLSDPLMSVIASLNLSAKSFADAGAGAFRGGRFQDAVEYFGEAVLLDPDNATTHQALGSAFVKVGNAERAEHHYREALRLDPQFVEAHYFLAILIDFLGRTDEAVVHYQQVANIQPGFRDALDKLADGLQRTDRCDADLTVLADSVTREKVAAGLKARCP